MVVCSSSLRSNIFAKIKLKTCVPSLQKTKHYDMIRLCFVINSKILDFVKCFLITRNKKKIELQRIFCLVYKAYLLRHIGLISADKNSDLNHLNKDNALSIVDLHSKNVI